MKRRWHANSVHYNPETSLALPGIYALYQKGRLKYIGQSENCAARIRQHCSRRRGIERYLTKDRKQKCDAWKPGVAIVARVQPLLHLTGGRGTEDERRREKVERWWLYHLRPPCNADIPETEPPRPVDLPP